ncbi:MAG: hypothetical protein HW387_1300 [Parachlamydiales bacterium]|nr:hypothetical protein [Parachlamydiales bacterium]
MTTKVEIAKGSATSCSPAPSPGVDDPLGPLSTRVMTQTGCLGGAPVIDLDKADREAATKVIDETLQKMRRELINGCISYCERIVNAPVRYESRMINVLIQSYLELRQKEGYKDIVLDFSGLLQLSNALQQSLQQKEGGNHPLMGNFRDERGETPFEGLMDKALDAMNLMEGSTIRLLEPGNNDQATPMFVAHQIKHIRDYAARKRINLNIEVLVMGQGGHPTTATFPQFAQIHADKSFTGTPEAISLSATLIAALRQREIPFKIVDTFTAKKEGCVQIKLAKASRNTGENVDEASKVYESDTQKVRHVFVCSSIASSTRQAQTFAQQYSGNRNNPVADKYYDSITAIPLPRTKQFIESALNPQQAVTELYYGLTERARLYLYAFQSSPFVPASPIDVRDLENLYQSYAQLSGQAIETAKRTAMKDLMKFFNDRFQIMEKAIPWNKPVENQLKGTNNAMREMVRRCRAFHLSCAIASASN